MATGQGARSAFAECRLMGMSEQATFDRQFYEALCLAAGGDHQRAQAGFLECVIGEPACGEYVRECLANLQRSAGMDEIGDVPPAAELEKKLQRAAHDKHWSGVLRYGPRLLARRPRDVPMLLALADACEAQGHQEPEL